MIKNHSFKFQLFNERAGLLYEKTLEEIAEIISKGEFKTAIELIRERLNAGEEEKAKQMKLTLPAFVSAGKFDTHLAAENLQEYYGMMTLDFDHVEGDIENIRSKINESPYTLMSFVSPSGKGLKIVVGTDATKETHEIGYLQVMKHFEHITGLNADKVNKNIARKCFLSYDYQSYFNPEARVFQVVDANEESILYGINPSTIDGKNDIDAVFQNLVKFTERKAQYQNGNRNNFIFQLACNANRAGISEEEVMENAAWNYNLDSRELNDTIKSAYKHNSFEFGQYASLVSLASDSDFNFDEDYCNTPTIPDEVYEKLPKLLTDGCEVFKSERERDVFLTGAITLLSGCFPKIRGRYEKDSVYSNLNCLIIAPAASGKGALKYSSKIVEPLHNDIKSKSKEDRKKFDELHPKTKKQNLKSNNDQAEKPPKRIFIIPANISSSALIKILSDNGGIGVICETEIDTMSGAIGQDWGGYSDMIRKSFHHEKISFARKLNDEFIEIPNPRLSIALSGTPNQVPKLIKSTEDGLFSRFIFYNFVNFQEWRDVTPDKQGDNPDQIFANIGYRVHLMSDFYGKSTFRFDLAKEQWIRLNSAGSESLKDITYLNGAETSSIIYRLGLIKYRIAMVLSIIRTHEEQIPLDMNDTITCNDSDFWVAEKLSEIYLEHAISMFKRLPKASWQSGNQNVSLFYENLPPVEFGYEEAVKVGGGLGIKSRTVGKYLKELKQNGLLLQPLKHKGYIKKDC